MINADFNDVVEKYYGKGKVVKAHKADNILSFEKKQQYRNDDLTAIRKADGLVCVLLETSRVIGSVKEIFYAHEIAKKPVYLISIDKRFTKHMWHDIEVTAVFETILDFIEFLKGKEINTALTGKNE